MWGKDKKHYTLFSKYQPSGTPRFDLLIFIYLFGYSFTQSFKVPRFTVSFDPWTRERGEDTIHAIWLIDCSYLGTTSISMHS